MARAHGRTRPCGEATARNRFQKAREFLAAAESITDKGDAYVTLCVVSGIASSDVLCCRRLGEHTQGDDHAHAVALLRRLDFSLAEDLQTLLGMKTRSAYGEAASSDADVRRAGRAARRLLDAARQSRPLDG